MIKKLTLLAFLTVFGTCAFAQVSYGFYAGVIKPAGDLGQTKTISGANDLNNIQNWCLIYEDGKYGFAKLGFNVGFDMAIKSNLLEGISYLTSFDIMYNNSDSNITSYFEEYPKNTSGIMGAGFSSKSPQWMNFPLLFGVSYKYDFGSALGIFCEAAIGPNFRKIIDCEETWDYYNTQTITIGLEEVSYTKKQIIYDYDFTMTFGFKVGAGILFWNDQISLGFDYYSLGSAKIKGETIVKLDGKEHGALGNSFKGNNSISSSELVFRVGYHF